jgi:hypothetical protein
MQIEQLQAAVIHFIGQLNFHGLFPTCIITVKLINVCLVWIQLKLVVDGSVQSIKAAARILLYEFHIAQT